MIKFLSFMDGFQVAQLMILQVIEKNEILSSFKVGKVGLKQEKFVSYLRVLEDKK